MFLPRRFYIAAAIAASFASLTVAVPTQRNETSTGAPTWEPCGSPYNSSVLCTSISVPMDYSDPTGETISLKLLKTSATNQSARIGTMVFQYGGPGTAGSTPFMISGFYGFEEYFDIVVADPRGIGVNYPVECDPKYDDMKFNYFPRTEAEYAETQATFREMGVSCHKRTGRVMEFMDSITQAKDLEAVRLAIGEGGLNYYGVSWGTLRGQLYAELFPNNVRAMIIDAVVDHSASTSQLYASQAAAWSMSQRRMLEWMEKSPDSVLQGRNVRKLWSELVQKADSSPIPAPECVTSDTCSPRVTGSDLRTQAFTPANDPEVYWAGYAEVYRQAFDNGNVTALSPLYITDDSPIQQVGAQYAIICQDWEWPEGWEEYEKLQYMSASMSLDLQTSNGARLWALACPNWPTKVTDPPRELSVQTKSPIMIVHALWDPATGYDTAVAVHRQFPGSYLLTRYGEGHGSYNYPVTVKAMIDYLIDPSSVDPRTSPLIEEPMSPMLTDFEMMGWSE